ncbi:hypothetical protein BHM03_00045191 [Ensete ventricosum]|nr:hypothetical protein BHM03_00045191 [Ensete ventricosum]
MDWVCQVRVDGLSITTLPGRLWNSTRIGDYRYLNGILSQTLLQLNLSLLDFARGGSYLFIRIIQVPLDERGNSLLIGSIPLSRRSLNSTEAGLGAFHIRKQTICNVDPQALAFLGLVSFLGLGFTRLILTFPQGASSVLSVLRTKNVTSCWLL